MRAARGFLALHAVLILASIVAFQIVVDKPAPPGFDPALWAAAYAVGMRVTGPLYIVTGFLAALLATVALLGVRRGLAAAAAVVAISLMMELLGTSTGLPFGPYGYGDHLGPKILGLVPIVIPLSWFLMLYASLGVAVGQGRGLLATAAIASAGLLAWDTLMDPTMSAVFPFWSWHTGGVYYGMPLLNWFGWALTGVLIALGMLLVAGRRILPLAGSRFALALYALNGIFPLALALRDGLHGAALAGSGAMLLFLLSSLRPWRSPVPADLRLHRT